MIAVKKTNKSSNFSWIASRITNLIMEVHSLPNWSKCPHIASIIRCKRSGSPICFQKSLSCPRKTNEMKAVRTQMKFRVILSQTTLIACCCTKTRILSRYSIIEYETITQKNKMRSIHMSHRRPNRSSRCIVCLLTRTRVGIQDRGSSMMVSTKLSSMITPWKWCCH